MLTMTMLMTTPSGQARASIRSSAIVMQSTELIFRVDNIGSSAAISSTGAVSCSTTVNIVTITTTPIDCDEIVVTNRIDVSSFNFTPLATALLLSWFNWWWWWW